MHIALPTLPDFPKAGPALMPEGAHWGTLETSTRVVEAGLLSRSEYFGVLFLAVDVPIVKRDQKIAEGEPLLKLTLGTGMVRRLYPIQHVKCITLTDEADARTQAVELAFRDVVHQVAEERAAFKEPEMRSPMGGKIDLDNQAPNEGELGDVHMGGTCAHSKGHMWVRIWSVPKVAQDPSPEHPAETKNLAVWFECAFCPAWAEVKDTEGGES